MWDEDCVLGVRVYKCVKGPWWSSHFITFAGGWETMGLRLRVPGWHNARYLIGNVDPSGSAPPLVAR